MSQALRALESLHVRGMPAGLLPAERLHMLSTMVSMKPYITHQALFGRHKRTNKLTLKALPSCTGTCPKTQKYSILYLSDYIHITCMIDV